MASPAPGECGSASGSCAWGSFRSAANPVLRDVTERVIVASKGRFGRARSPKERRRDGLPHESSVGADDFMALTLDVWDIPPESAVRVQHPAPFPVELPQRLMELYTFRGDLVVDPFSNEQTRISDFAYGFVEHSGEIYGQLSVYYRVAGMVPPESRPKK